jgi:hypothetical protein
VVLAKEANVRARWRRPVELRPRGRATPEPQRGDPALPCLVALDVDERAVQPHLDFGAEPAQFPGGVTPAGQRTADIRVQQPGRILGMDVGVRATTQNEDAFVTVVKIEYRSERAPELGAQRLLLVRWHSQQSTVVQTHVIEPGLERHRGRHPGALDGQPRGQRADMRHR